MPLSEDEQRILRQIEQELQSDPTFATRVHRVPRRRLLVLTIGLVATIVATIAALTVHWALAVAAFVAVLLVAVALEREVRVIARERLGTLPVSVWLGAARRRNDPPR